MENIFELDQLTHAALAQFYRWFQVYEIPFTENTLTNHKDILSNDVEISSQNGTTKGKEGLEERLNVFTGWKNAHHVKNTEVTLLKNGQIGLKAHILYQNIRPDESKYSYTIQYETQLKKRSHDLPVFSNLDLHRVDVINDFKFENSYSENRTLSFLHYWLYIMETVQADKFEELLADEFALNLSTSGTITDIKSFKDWVNNIPKQVKTASHQIKNLLITDHDDGTIGVQVDFDWRGISVKDEKMIAETHHEWLLINNTEERFARLKHMKVTPIQPFQVVEEFNEEPLEMSDNS